LIGLSVKKNDGTFEEVSITDIIRCPIIYYVQTQQKILTHPTNESVFNGGNGTRTIFANDFNPNDIYEIDICGSINVTDTPTNTISVYLNNVLIGIASGALTSLSNQFFCINIKIKVESIGENGVIKAYGLSTITSAGQVQSNLQGRGIMPPIVLENVDTTIDNVIDVKYNSTESTLTIENITIIKIKGD